MEGAYCQATSSREVGYGVEGEETLLYKSRGLTLAI
jgi:hypothetical protein